MKGVRPDSGVYNEHGQRLCEYRGCNRLHNGNGLCQSHQKQLSRKRPLSPLPKRDHEECSHDGCSRWVKSQGQCDLHYGKKYMRNYYAHLRERLSELENYINELQQENNKENN